MAFCESSQSPDGAVPLLNGRRRADDVFECVDGHVMVFVAKKFRCFSSPPQDGVSTAALLLVAMPEADDDNADQDGHEDDHSDDHQAVVDRVVDNGTVVQYT